MTQFNWLSERLIKLGQEGQLRELTPRQLEGTTLRNPEGRSLVNFGSNDYLGIAGEDRESIVLRSGSGASPLVCGFTQLHKQLCDQLALFEETEQAVLFPTGYAACSGTISALAESGDLILSDSLNHASLIDGCRLSKATCIRYPHGSAEAVHQQLATHRNAYNHAWIVTDAVFSMDGDVAPLGPLADVADRWDATLVVDEAHGTGVLGDKGSGACEAAGVKHRVPIRIGTLSKAIGSQGGFVAAPRPVIQFLINRARPLIYSTSAVPHSIAAAIEGLRILQTEPARRFRVTDLARHVRKRLGIVPNGSFSETVPIIPVLIGDAERAVAVSADLANAGFYVPAIRPPTVPTGTARLRISLSAAHTDQQINDLLAALETHAEVRKRISHQ